MIDMPPRADDTTTQGHFGTIVMMSVWAHNSDSTCGTAPLSVGRDSSPGRCAGAVLAAGRGFDCILRKKVGSSRLCVSYTSCCCLVIPPSSSITARATRRASEEAGHASLRKEGLRHGSGHAQQTCLCREAVGSGSTFFRLRGGIGRLSLLNTTTPLRLRPFTGRPPYACLAY